MLLFRGAILYCKSLSKFITTLKSISKRFCAISLTCSSMSILLICVYLSTNYGTSQSHDLYLEVLGKLKGFIDAQFFDKVIVACDFNVDLIVEVPPVYTYKCLWTIFNCVLLIFSQL